MHNPAMASRSSRPAPTPARTRRPILLAGLRGFEAAARLLSFTLAAQELNLTQSSISRQIKTLEDQVGKPLFRRRIRHLELTAAGQRLYRVVHDSLGNIDRTVVELRRTTHRKRITLTTFASFASLMLVPRLSLFSEIHPDIDIRIEAVDEVRDLENDNIDVAIRYCRIDHAPPGAVMLLDEELTPALSPVLLARIGPLRKPRDLARTTFLVQDLHLPYDEFQSWDRWFAQMGETTPRDAPTLSLNFTYQAIEAAIRGQGVMLAPVVYIREHVERGQLVCPFPTRMASPHGYYMIVNRNSAEQPHVAAFTRWLTEQLGPDELRNLREEAATA
jgi:LysR family transcriptional regulator, glycine cleavage system transcriptional activator